MFTITKIRIFSTILSLVFIAFIYTPPLIALFNKSQGISQSEKRKLAELPEFQFSMEYIKSFPENFQAFFKDHFGLRLELTRLHHYFLYY